MLALFRFSFFFPSFSELFLAEYRRGGIAFRDTRVNDFGVRSL